MKRSDVCKVLDEMVENKKIDDWNVGEYEYWKDIPYIEIKNNRVYLCETYCYLGNYGIKTIFNYSSKKSVKDCIDFIIKNFEMLDYYCISTLQQLKDTKRGL